MVSKYETEQARKIVLTVDPSGQLMLLFFKVISLLESYCFERKCMSRHEMKKMISLRELVIW